MRADCLGLEQTSHQACFAYLPCRHGVVVVTPADAVRDLLRGLAFGGQCDDHGVGRALDRSRHLRCRPRRARPEQAHGVHACIGGRDGRIAGQVDVTRGGGMESRLRCEHGACGPCASKAQCQLLAGRQSMHCDVQGFVEQAFSGECSKGDRGHRRLLRHCRRCPLSTQSSHDFLGQLRLTRLLSLNHPRLASTSPKLPRTLLQRDRLRRAAGRGESPSQHTDRHLRRRPVALRQDRSLSVCVAAMQCLGHQVSSTSIRMRGAP